MKLSFDKFERYEMPQVTLCNPNSRATEVDGKITITDTVGVLSNPKGMNLKLNFNAPHELSFDYYLHKSADPIKQSFYDNVYEAIQTDRYIYLTDIGYFIISSVTDSDEDNIDKKSISCKSCEENELATAEGLYLEEGTYYLHAEDSKGLLNLFLPKTAGWTMGYIDPSLLTKPYYVEETEVDNGYNFLYTTIQDMFECIVEPDIIKRTISVYSRTYYAEHHLTDIHIAKYNLLKHKTVEENDEDKYTALNVQGKDENLEIRTVNPTGKNVIYNFEPRYAWMSPALQQAIAKWQEKCESVENEYLTLQQGYYAELEKLFNEEQDIEVLKGELKTLEETRDAVIITVGDQQSTALDNVNTQISTKQTEINTATSNYNAHKATVQTTYETPINQINKDCALDITAVDIDGNTIFTVEILNELMTHIKPTDYVDEYMLVTESMDYPQRFEKAKELMDRAQSQLVKISSGQKTYSIDTRSFLFNKQFRHFSEQLCAGAIIYVETKNDTMEQLHLTGIDISFDEKSTNFTLGNKYDRSDLKALYDDALGQNSKSFSELKYIAGIIEDQQKQLDYQRNWVADLRTLTLDNVLTSEDQAIEINNRGLIGRKRKLDENGEWDFDENGNPYFEPEQVKLINNTLVFTEDNWETASTAVGKIAVGYKADGSVKYSYGINGQVLIGELILGNNLVLTGTGAGIKITDSKGNNVFYADENGNLVLSGTIFASAGQIAGWTISGSLLKKDTEMSTTVLVDGTEYKGSTVFLKNSTSFYHPQDTNKTKADDVLVIGLERTDGTWDWPFGLRKDGTLVSTRANILGKVTANSGNIGGWTIEKSILYSYPSQGGAGTGFMSGTSVSTNPCFYAGYARTMDPRYKDYKGSLTQDEATKLGLTNYKKLTAEQITYYPSTPGLNWADYGIVKVMISQNGRLELGSKNDSSYLRYMPDGNGLTIKGDITATGGIFKNVTITDDCTITNGAKLANWIVGYNSLTNGTLGSDGSIHLYTSYPDSSTAIIAGHTGHNWRLGIGSHFGVDKDGKMYCTGGKIGGWTLENHFFENKVYDTNGSYLYRTGIAALSTANSAAFYAGCTTDTGNSVVGKSAFYVTNAGNMYCNNATIAGGTITMPDNSDKWVELGTSGGLRVLDMSSEYLGYYACAQYSANILRFGRSTTFNGTITNTNELRYYAYQSSAYIDMVGTWKLNNEPISVGSDKNIKHNIESLDDNYCDLFDDLKPVKFKYNNGTSNRYHTGFIAQDVCESTVNAGLTTNDFAAYVEFLKEDGDIECGLRYEEFIALNTWQIQRAKRRIADLENTVTELKTQIQTLTAG